MYATQSCPRMYLYKILRNVSSYKQNYSIYLQFNTAKYQFRNMEGWFSALAFKSPLNFFIHTKYLLSAIEI